MIQLDSDINTKTKSPHNVKDSEVLLEKNAIKEARDELLKPDKVNVQLDEQENIVQQRVNIQFSKGGATLDDKMVDILDEKTDDLSEE